MIHNPDDVGDGYDGLHGDHADDDHDVDYGGDCVDAGDDGYEDS